MFILVLYFNLGQLSEHKNGNSPSYIAIDDISFTPGCVVASSTVAPGQTTITPHSIVTPLLHPCGNASKWQCQTSKKCIDVIQKCNFHNDCGPGDNSDEKECGTCTFENNDARGNPDTCGWVNLGTSKNEWAVREAGRLPWFPTLDGASNRNGRFMIIDSSRGLYIELNEIYGR